VIAHLYEEYGPQFPRRLDGMFAVAVWDANLRRLTLARDRLGKKPLFYCLRGSVLTFASELQSLLQDPEIPRTPDHVALDMFLALRYVPAPMSAYRAVAKLAPAHTLVFEGGQAQLACYWQPEYEPKLETTDERELGEQLRTHLRHAVRTRLVADVPVGALLSGGVDSAAVVATMAEECAGPVRTFSIGFEHELIDERPAARIVAERFGTEHREFVVRPDAARLLPEIVRHHGEPFGDPTAIPMFYLCEMTRGHVTVALTGDGGDEVFGGYTRYATNLALSRLGRAPAPLRAALAAAASGVPVRAARIDSWPARIRRAAGSLDLDDPRRYFSYVSHLDALKRDALYTDEFRESIDLEAPERLIARAWSRSPVALPLDRMLDADRQTYLPDDLLCKADIASMARSLELRSPLLDRELVEFAARLPEAMKIRRGAKKVLLRNAMRGIVPDAVLDAPKRGFHPPMASWLRGPLSGLARELLLDPTARGRGHFRPERLAALLGRHIAGSADNSEMLWRLMVYEFWHRELVDGVSSGSDVLGGAV
jgi:asparagine synthase (glutamine-hydrolysing)